MNIANHRLEGEGIDYRESPNQGGSYAPGALDTIIIHYTAGANAESAIRTLSDTERKVSAHLVVGRDGSVTQMLPFDTVGWHAGVSTWGDREGFNKYSIGIEIDNAGQLEEKDGQYISWFGQAYPPEEVVRGVHRNQTEPTCWHRFPPEQVRVVEELCRLLIDEYDIRHILGHEEIAPDRKIDPGPAFPLDDFRARLLAPPVALVDPVVPPVRRRDEPMRITAIKPFVIDAGVFVKVETDAGIYGLGEAGMKRRGRAIAETIHSMTPDLIGQDPFRIEHLWQVMFRGGFFPGGGVQTSAVSAVDIALWDIKAKALGVPVYELLGGRVRDRVVCYPHNGDPKDIDKLIESCRETRDAGYRFARWGMVDPEGDAQVLEPSRAVRFGIEQVRAVRETLGDEIEICVDVHTRLDPSAAIQFCKGVEQYRPFFIEDPIRSESSESLRLVRQHTSVPLAVGEQWAGKWAFRQVIEEELMDYARIDLCIAGGLTEARKIAGWCETHYIHLAPHNPLGPVSTAACAHLCFASPLVGVQECPRPPGTAHTDVFPVQVPFADGHLLPPEVPGLGVELDEEALVEGEPRAGAGIWFVREDGSYTNW